MSEVANSFDKRLSTSPAPESEADSSPLFQDFTLSDCHYTLQLFRRVFKWREYSPVVMGPTVVAGVATILFAVCAVPSAITGHLGSSFMGSDLDQVLNRPGFYPPRPVPLLRDYAFLSMIAITALSYWHFARQWGRIEKLPTLLEKGGLLNAGVPKEVLSDSFASLTAQSCKKSWEAVALFISIAIIAGVTTAILQQGLYPLVDHGKDVAQVHFDGWWANPSVNWGGFVAFLVVLTFFMFITVRHAIMGWHILLFFGRMRRKAQEQRPRAMDAGVPTWFGYTDPWAAPEEALGELRGAVLDVFLAIALGACAAACAVYAVRVPYQLALILSIFLLYNLAIFVIPWVYLNRQLSRSRQLLQREILEKLRTARSRPTPTTTADAEWLWRAYERVAGLPDRVVNRLPVGALVAFYLLPVLALLPAYR